MNPANEFAIYLQKSKEKVSTPAKSPVSFPGWREVLQSEGPDPAELRTGEQDIFAWLKFLKAATAGVLSARQCFLPSRQLAIDPRGGHGEIIPQDRL